MIKRLVQWKTGPYQFSAQTYFLQVAGEEEGGVGAVSRGLMVQAK